LVTLERLWPAAAFEFESRYDGWLAADESRLKGETLSASDIQRLSDNLNLRQHLAILGMFKVLFSFL
jgi:hypothetical protein